MKKLVLILVSVLLFVYILLSLLSFRGNYCAERELWGIDHRLIFIAAHQESTPDYVINQLVRNYRFFAKKYSGSIYEQSAQLMIGNLYSLRNNLPQARLEFQKAVSKDKELSAEAVFAIAKTYEIEGHWDKALGVYKSVIHNYSDTNTGFSTPMYLTTHLVSSGEQKIYTNEAYADALSFYQRIADKSQKSNLDYNSLRMIAICLLYQKDWSGTVQTMGEIILKYPVAEAIKEAIKTINILCVTKLHDYDAAINIYTQFIQKYPDHKADPILKKMIKDLQILKNRKLIVQTAPKGNDAYANFSKK